MAEVDWVLRKISSSVRAEPGERSLEDHINTLVYTMGDVVDDILSRRRQGEYDVVAKFEAHFIKK